MADFNQQNGQSSSFSFNPNAIEGNLSNENTAFPQGFIPPVPPQFQTENQNFQTPLETAPTSMFADNTQEFLNESTQTETFQAEEFSSQTFQNEVPQNFSAENQPQVFDSNQFPQTEIIAEFQNNDFAQYQTENSYEQNAWEQTPAPKFQQEFQTFEPAQEILPVEETLIAENNDPMDRQVVPFQQGVDIIKLVNDMFESALAQGASDIHIEPFEPFLTVRFRIDGDFHEYFNFATEYAESILTRIEVLAGLKLDKNRLPQDGKISFHSQNGVRVDMRVSTFPTMYGNKVCIRLLVKEDSVKTLQSLGYDERSLQIIQKNLERTYGMVLMTGPTGSGKSTTLFAMLSSFNPREYNISTLEDPIEYFIPGANQSQVNAEIGYDFPDGLRTLVRQDPDIIMVGEIRDKVTASLAVNAAITGHLVFSTLHANTASATIQRLMNMDVDHFLVASALNLIVSQRLVRRICPHCKTSFTPDERTLANVRSSLEHVPNAPTQIEFFRGNGCDACKGTGYKGRVAIYELLEVTPEISKVIIEKQGVAEEIEKVAVSQGMVTIKQNGILAALKGETTLEEVLLASDSGN